MSYYDAELQPLVDTFKNDIKVKFHCDSYITKWMNVNLDSIESIQAFLDIVKELKISRGEE